MTDHWIVWAIAAVATACVILRPFAWPEWIWAAAGAVALVASQMLSPQQALAGVRSGLDVYLFLIGMMLLAELAREEGLFDWLAGHAARAARGSPARLFSLVFAVGTIVTIFLSNDATAVVLTPAVAAVARTAEVAEPLPYLFICAFIANAASFVLPISNPANLVIYGTHMPPLLEWLQQYALPSLLAIVATYAVLRWTQRAHLRQAIKTEIAIPPLSGPAKRAAIGIIVAALALIAASAADIALGLPTFAAGIATTVLVLAKSRTNPGKILGHISWGVLPLVAGLFVLVAALQETGLTAAVAGLLRGLATQSPDEAHWATGLLLGFGANLVNNLPAGLLAGRVVELANAPAAVRAATLIGVDLGPNLSVTGSLATILWLTALRREGQHCSAWTFLKLGALVMPPALILALLVL